METKPHKPSLSLYKQKPDIAKTDAAQMLDSSPLYPQTAVLNVAAFSAIYHEFFLFIF